MADCHDLFEKFLEEITLHDSKKLNLIAARDALREKIKTYFRDKKKFSVPKFHGQGSYMMRTVVNPLDGEYDIDDGVYLQHLGEDKSRWPSPSEAHKWIYEAVDGHTNEKPFEKPTCIRVIYVSNYHVDLPIYSSYKGDYYLADKNSGWRISDPKSITDWFVEKVGEKGEQLRNIVKYMKAWVDNQAQTNGKMPSSLIITKLVTDNFVSRVRDDVSLSKTVASIDQLISQDFTVNNPIDNAEIISDRIDANQKEVFKRLIKKMAENSESAIKEENKKKACTVWRKEFGDRFYDCNQIRDDKGALYTAAPALLRNDARSA